MSNRTQKMNIVSADEIKAAGGFDKWAKKVGYDSSKIKMSGIIDIPEKEMLDILKNSN